MSIYRKIRISVLVTILLAECLFFGIPEIKSYKDVTKNISNNVVIEGTSSTRDWVGSGVIVTKNGIIVTAGHCVKGASKLKITMSNGTVFYTSKYYYDYSKDIGLIKLPAVFDSYSAFGYSDELDKGDRIYTIGNPQGIWDGKITRGRVYQVHFSRNILRTHNEFVLAILDVVGGNSGGGVYKNGKCIGIVSMGGMGATFIVPSSQIVKVLHKFKVKPAVNHIN